MHNGCQARLCGAHPIWRNLITLFNQTNGRRAGLGLKSETPATERNTTLVTLKTGGTGRGEKHKSINALFVQQLVYLVFGNSVEDKKKIMKRMCD